MVVLGLLIVALGWLAICRPIIRSGRINEATMQRITKVLFWAVGMSAAGVILGGKGFPTPRDNAEHALSGGAIGLVIGMLVPLNRVNKPMT
jgi:hypothetical protein